jgi:hypothetical protein
MANISSLENFSIARYMNKIFSNFEIGESNSMLAGRAVSLFFLKKNWECQTDLPI